MQRGRPSSASLSVSGPLETVQRPDAPYGLTDEEAKEWWAVVNRLPAEWFPRETHGLLTNYCRHIVAADKISQLIAQVEESQPLNIVLYEKLLRTRGQEVRNAIHLATKMRITQKSEYDQRRRKKDTSFTPLDAPWVTRRDAD